MSGYMVIYHDYVGEIISDYNSTYLWHFHPLKVSLETQLIVREQ